MSETACLGRCGRMLRRGLLALLPKDDGFDRLLVSEGIEYTGPRADDPELLAYVGDRLRQITEAEDRTPPALVGVGVEIFEAGYPGHKPRQSLQDSSIEWATEKPADIPGA